MKIIVNLNLLFILLGILYPGLQVSAQSNSKWGISAFYNSTDAQLGDPEWNSWGYAKGNFNNFGDIADKSISVSIMPRYFISKDVLLRLELGITHFNLENNYDANALTSSSPATTSIINQHIKQNIYRFVPGIQWNLIKVKFIEPYCGITASYLHYANMIYKNRNEVRDLPANTINHGLEDNATATGGFAAGGGAFAGFNIYMNKRISLGAETSFSLLYYKLGGTFSGKATSLGSNPPGNEAYSYSTSSYTGVRFSKIMPSINVSFLF